MFSFLCSWAIWNYRLLIILFSSTDPEKKFAHVEALSAKSYLLHLFPSFPPEAYWLCIGFMGPLLTTLFYLLVLPKFEAMALKISLEKSVQLKGIKLEAENATPIAHDESIHLREMIREAEEARDAAIERQRILMQKEVDKKQKELDDAQNAINANHHDSISKETTMQNEINALRQAKDNLEHELANSEDLIKAVFSLDQGAREMLFSISDGRVKNLKVFAQQDHRANEWFGQLYATGLATSFDGIASLTPLGQKLVLKHQLLSNS
ncbi:hypothetical protein IM543_03500 [Massilia sp. UMI-21]|nr:hypothetical protein IM543_03500 [Massilia sp. UMI-21]